MTIFNRRNAVLGWLVWTVGKRQSKRKAKGAVPALDRRTRRPNASALVALVTAAAGAVAVLFRRRRRTSDE